MAQRRGRGVRLMWKWLIAKAPKVGSTWDLVGNIHDPFKKDSLNWMVIKDVKAGYVKYARPFWNERSFLSSSIRDFRFIYREVK